MIASPDAQLLDVRTSKEFVKGHLLKAKNIDWNNAESFKNQVLSLDKTRPVLVYCYSGGRSANAMEYLLKEGFKNVINMNGGFLKWAAKGKPNQIEDNTEPAQAMTLAEMNAVLKDKKLVMIDFYAEWCGPCQKMLPVISKLKAEMEDKVNIVKLDSDRSKEIMGKFNVDEIPTFLFFKNEKLINRVVGYMTEDTMRMLIKEGLDK
jgi:thioredoxin